MMKKQVLVVGVGRFGGAVATTLAEKGHEVVAIDRDEARLRSVVDVVTHAAVADGSDEASLLELGVGNFDVVIIAIGGDFEAGVLATVAAKAAGAKWVLAKATTATAARVLQRVGADEVVRPEHDMGVWVGHKIASPSIVDAFDLGPGHEVLEVEVTDQPELLGSLADLRLPSRFGIHVVAVDRSGVVHVTPGAAFELRSGDRLVAIGTLEAVDLFERAVGG